MTFEKRCTVEPDDIFAVNLECIKCGSSVRVPLAKMNAEQVHRLALSPCRNCQQPSGFSSEGTSEAYAVESFIGALAGLSATMKGRNLRLKMEVKCAD
jgi:hypothetical protein